MNTTTAKNLPSQGEQLLKELSWEEKRRICKTFPFPAIRNRTFLELREKGARIKALAEVSGLERVVVGRIIKKEKAKREAERLLMGRKKR